MNCYEVVPTSHNDIDNNKTESNIASIDAELDTMVGAAMKVCNQQYKRRLFAYSRGAKHKRISIYIVENNNKIFVKCIHKYSTISSSIDNRDYIPIEIESKYNVKIMARVFASAKIRQF